MRRNKRWAIGVDLGGTKILAARVDSEGKIIRRIRAATDLSRGPEGVKDEIVSAAKQLALDAGTKPAGIGVGVAGQVDPKTGRVRFAPNLGWANEPFKEDLDRALGIPVVVTNDVRAATWGEWLHGAGRGYENLVCLFVGTGIGGGVVLNGRVITGCSNSAGELGHITIDLRGPQCRCGNYGCMEALAGGWAIAKQARDLALADPIAGSFLLEKVQGVAERITAKVVFEGARAEDPLALKIVDRVSQALIAGAVSLVNAFNPCLFILGGGVIKGHPELIKKIAEGVKQHALPPAREPLKIIRARLHNDAGVVGAAALAMHSQDGST